MAMLLVTFVIFSAALFGAAYYVWAIPAQHAEEDLARRLRDLRSRGGAGKRSRPGASDIVRREQRGTFSYFTDFVAWAGGER